jgi:hypothetical protein
VAPAPPGGLYHALPCRRCEAYPPDGDSYNSMLQALLTTYVFSTTGAAAGTQ